MLVQIYMRKHMMKNSVALKIVYEIFRDYFISEVVLVIIHTYKST